MFLLDMFMFLSTATPNAHVINESTPQEQHFDAYALIEETDKQEAQKQAQVSKREKQAPN